MPTRIHLICQRLLCLVSIALLCAAPVNVLNATTSSSAEALLPSKNLGPGIQFWRDRAHDATITSLLNHPPEWRTNVTNTPNLGVDAAPVWFYRALPTNVQPPTVLEIAYPALDHIEVFFVRDAEVVARTATGDRLPLSDRLVQHRHFVIPIPDVNTDADRPLELYMRVQTDGAMQVPIYLWHEASFWQQDQWQLLAHSALIAILLTIAVYNMMLFISLRDRAYLFYVLFVLNVSVTQMGLRGFLAQIFTPHQPLLAEHLLLISLGGGVFFACMFASSFMTLAQRSPRLNRALLVLAALGLTQAALSPFMAYTPSLKAGIGITAIACPLLLLIGVQQWIRGVKVARFFTLAWGFLLCVQFAITLSKFGWLPRTTLIEYGPEIGAAIEAILLSFALADRMNEERRQRYAAQHAALLHEKAARTAQETALNAQNRANAALEERVAERTRDLSRALDDLSELNARLENLSAKDGLTGLDNRYAFNDNYDREWRRCAREKVELSLLMIDVDELSLINKGHGHLAGDACLKRVADEAKRAVRRPADRVARFDDEEFAVLLPNTSLNGAMVLAQRIRSTIEEKGMLYEGKVIPLAVSVGVSSVIPGKHLEPPILIQQANEALQRAKRTGRNRVMFAEMYDA